MLTHPVRMREGLNRRVLAKPAALRNTRLEDALTAASFHGSSQIRGGAAVHNCSPHGPNGAELCLSTLGTPLLRYLDLRLFLCRARLLLALRHEGYEPLAVLNSKPTLMDAQAAPSNTFGPVGCGAPPTGSIVTANAFAGVFGGTSAVHMLPHACPPGPNNPALTGAPFTGTSHI
jgi:hypothetical protein